MAKSKSKKQIWIVIALMLSFGVAYVYFGKKFKNQNEIE